MGSRKKKYQAKHDLVRKYVPKDIWQIADSAIDHIGGIIDKTGPRDVVYIVAYMAAVDLSYRVLKVATTSILPILLRTIFPWLPVGPPDEPGPDIDWKILSVSLVAAYAILKIDIEDVSTAMTKLTGAIKTAVPASVLVAP